MPVLLSTSVDVATWFSDGLNCSPGPGVYLARGRVCVLQKFQQQTWKTGLGDKEPQGEKNLVLGTPGKAQRLGTHDTFSNCSPGSGQVWLDAEPRRQGLTHSLQVCVQRWNPAKGSRALG